jgi:arginine decarboxylase-like protein
MWEAAGSGLRRLTFHPARQHELLDAEYANDVIYTVGAMCRAEGSSHAPHHSESGRRSPRITRCS